MIDLRVELPRADNLRLLRMLDGKAVIWAEMQALNRTAANVQTEALKLVAKDMGVPVSKLKKRGRKVDVSLAMSGSKAGKFGAISPGRKATRRRLEASVRGFGRPFNVGRWDAQEVRAGATTSLEGRVRRGRGRVVGVMHSAYGRTQFAPRTWKLKNGAVVRAKRGGGIESVYGPGVTQVLEYRHIRRKLEAKAQDRLAHHFKGAVAYAFTAGARRTVR